MDSHISNEDINSTTSSTQRFAFERCDDNECEHSSNTSHTESPSRSYSKSNSACSSECHSVSGDDSCPEDPNCENDDADIQHISEFMTTSIEIPDFDPELLDGDFMSQDLFEVDDNESHTSDGRDDCEIVNIVHSDPRSFRRSSYDGDNFDLTCTANGSTMDPICVDDTNSARQSGTPTTSDHHPDDSNDGQSNESRSNDNTDHDNDDCIMGPIHWNKRSPNFPIDYYKPNKRISNAYRFIDDTFAEFNTLEDIEFLFKCPICYSTITRLRSGKVPNDNDKVIYSTKCGHLFCFECIKSVKSRKQCSICRKDLKDSNQYHVVFP